MRPHAQGRHQRRVRRKQQKRRCWCTLLCGKVLSASGRRRHKLKLRAHGLNNALSSASVSEQSTPSSRSVSPQHSRVSLVHASSEDEMEWEEDDAPNSEPLELGEPEGQGAEKEENDAEEATDASSDNAEHLDESVTSYSTTESFSSEDGDNRSISQYGEWDFDARDSGEFAVNLDQHMEEVQLLYQERDRHNIRTLSSIA